MDPTKYSIGYTSRGWIIYDQNGPIDGPFAQKSEAIALLDYWERENAEARAQEDL